ncbi:MAG: DUF3187 family protein [Planctomycetota bacterium]
MAFGGVFVLAGVGCALAPLPSSAPLTVRNQHPAQLTALLPGGRPVRAERPLAGVAAASLSWSNLWVLSDDGRDRVFYDAELLTATFGARVGLLPGVDLEFRVPVLHAGGGALDSWIESYHRLLGSPNSQRSDHPRNRFRVDASRAQAGGGFATAYRLDSGGVRLGDIPLIVTWFLFESTRARALSVGIRGGLELPTGQESAGLGNGGVDSSLGCVAGFECGPWAAFAWADHTWLHRARRAELAGLSYPGLYSAGVGAELGFAGGWSLVAQLQWEQSVLRRLDQENARRGHLLAWFGARARLSERLSAEFAVGEDLSPSTAPDITVTSGLAWRF